MSATVTDLPEPYFAVHMDEDRQGIRLYLDNRIAYNADYLKQTIVTEAGSATVRTAADGNVLTVRAGFRSGYTNAAVTKDVSFAYDAEVKEWKSVATPVYATVDNQHAVNGLKSLLAVDFDTELTTQTGLNHDLPFLNQFIFIDGLPMNEYGAAKGTDIRVNQIAPHSFNLWQFDAGTPNAKDFPAGTRILFRKGLQFVGEDGVNPGSRSDARGKYYVRFRRRLVAGDRRGRAVRRRVRGADRRGKSFFVRDKFFRRYHR